MLFENWNEQDYVVKSICGGYAYPEFRVGAWYFSPVWNSVLNNFQNEKILHTYHTLPNNFAKKENWFCLLFSKQ